MRITRKYWSSDAISKHFVQNDTNHYVIVNRKQTFKYKYKEIGTDKHLKATNLALITNYQGIFFYYFFSHFLLAQYKNPTTFAYRPFSI